jgi:hypothetical protein
MKLCQRCEDAIGELVAFKSGDELWDKLMIPNTQVPESECEFWAHKELNEHNRPFNIFSEMSAMRKHLTPQAYTEMLLRLAGPETE